MTSSLPAAQPRVAIPLSLSASTLRRPKGPVHSLAGRTMGTSWSAKLVGGDADALQRAIEAALDRVVSQMSSWEAASDLSRFHAAPAGQWMSIPPEFRQVIGCALRICRESGGAYDPAIGRLVDAWGFGPAGSRGVPPDPVLIGLARNRSGAAAIELADNSQMRRIADVSLDLSGIAKGFAVDLVAQTVRAHGVTDCLIEIGGELAGCGVKPDGTPWWVDIDTPLSAAAPVRVALHGLAVATSGCERAFTCNGRTYSHTIDPRTGMAIDNGMITATVVHRSCMEADAFATALMVLGPSAGLSFAARHGLAAVITHAPAGSRPCEHMTPAFASMLD